MTSVGHLDEALATRISGESGGGGRGGVGWWRKGGGGGGVPAAERGGRMETSPDPSQSRFTEQFTHHSLNCSLTTSAMNSSLIVQFTRHSFK